MKRSGMRSAAGGRRRARKLDGPTALVAILVSWPFLVGCADTVRPVLGGLKLGTTSNSFQMPVMENERAPFQYPRDAWKAGVGGETLLKIHIAADGGVDSVRVHATSGHPSLDSAAVEGARRLRYRPARHGGEPVGVWATLPVRYPMPEVRRAP